MSNTAVISIRGLLKQRVADKGKHSGAAGAGFELNVPSLTVRAGEVVALQGESGSGKSTLLDILALALRPDQVEQFCFMPRAGVRARPDRLWQSGAGDALAQLRAEYLGYVLQTGGLLPFLKVRENIALPCRLLGRGGAAVDVLAERLGIALLLSKYPAQLSLGERQRVAIARALVHRPSILLADEPTASLDPINAHIVFELLLELVDRFGATAVLASHDRARVAAASLQTLHGRLERDGDLTRALFWN